MARPAVTSDDVNDYLREITGEDVTAKDFRSWAATNLAAVALRELESYDSAMKAKKNVVRAVEAASQMLGSTPTICRKCYIHPAIFDGYLDGTLLDALRRRAEEALAEPDIGLSAEEAAVTAFLSKRLSYRLAFRLTGIESWFRARPPHQPRARYRSHEVKPHAARYQTLRTTRSVTERPADPAPASPSPPTARSSRTPRQPPALPARSCP
jgi:hypothetical protein